MLNVFTNKWESDDPDWAAVCMPPDWDGVIRERPHTPKRTHTPPSKAEAQIVTNMTNMATVWGWPLPHPAPPPPAVRPPAE